jgi:hypothetical protein
MEYPFIHAWGAYMGSKQYYIKDQVSEAKEDEAPQNAIYLRDGKWRTIDDVSNERAKEFCLDWVAKNSK